MGKKYETASKTRTRALLMAVGVMGLGLSCNVRAGTPEISAANTGCLEQLAAAAKKFVLPRRAFLQSVAVVAATPSSAGSLVLRNVAGLTTEQLDLVNGLARYSVNYYGVFSVKEGWVARRWQVGLDSKGGWLPDAAAVTRGMTPAVYKIVNESWGGKFGSFSRMSEGLATRREAQLSFAVDHGHVDEAVNQYKPSLSTRRVESTLLGLQNSTWPKFEKALIGEGFSEQAIAAARQYFFEVVTAEITKLVPVWQQIAKSSYERTIGDLHSAVKALQTTRQVEQMRREKELEEWRERRAKESEDQQKSEASQLTQKRTNEIIQWPPAPFELRWILGDLSDVKLAVRMQNSVAEDENAYVLNFAAPYDQSSAPAGDWVIQEVMLLRREHPNMEMTITVTTPDNHRQSARLDPSGKFVRISDSSQTPE